MREYDSFVSDIVSLGLSIKEEITYTIERCGFLSTITCVKFSGNKKRRGYTAYFDHEKTDLEECKKCGHFVRKTIAMNEMPWRKHFDLMITDGGNEMRKFIDCYPFYMCRRCLSLFYKEMKIEFENSKTRESLKLLRKEIRCKSKQQET